MKKILFFVNEVCPGGMTAALRDIISMLDCEKYHVSVVVAYVYGEMFNELKKDFDVRMPFEKFYFPNNRICRKLKSMVVNFVEKNRRKYPGLYHKLAIKENFDIEVAFTFKGIPQVIAKSPNKYSKKVAWIHGDSYTNKDIFSLHKDLSACIQCYEKFDKIVCVSQKAKDSFEDVLGIKNNVTVKYNPINDEKIRELSKEEVLLINEKSKEKVICSVGRLSVEKGYCRLVKIHAKLIKKGIAHKLVIVGEGEEREKLEQILREERIENSVFLTGYDSNPYKYMAKSDFFVCSSFTEGLPVVCQEALALGIPVVSSFPSVGELFGDETCGILSDVDDDSLMRAIEKMLTDDEFYKKCKAGAEKRAGYFDSKNSIKEIEKMFDELLENS